MSVGDVQDDVVRSGLDALHRRVAEDPGAAILLGFLEQAAREPDGVDGRDIGEYRAQRPSAL
jgi:hypothetical protein